MNTASSAVHVVDKDAFPGDLSADAAGLYFETVHGVTDDLAHASPTTSAVQYRKAPVDAPLALAGGRVDLLAFGSSAADVLSYNAGTLALVSAKRVSDKDDSIVGTGLGAAGARPALHRVPVLIGDGRPAEHRHRRHIRRAIGPGRVSAAQRPGGHRGDRRAREPGEPVPGADQFLTA